MRAFRPIETTLTLSKPEAAARQAQMAIAALAAGFYDSAITLAGAAENMVPGDPSVELTTQFMSSPEHVQQFGQKRWREALNFELAWLKHETPQFPATITVTIDTAATFVYRAIRKLPLECITEEMLSFEIWYRNRVEVQIAARDHT